MVIEEWIKLLADRSKAGEIGEYFHRKQCAELLEFLVELKWYRKLTEHGKMTNEEYFRTMPIDMLASFIVANKEFCGTVCPYKHETDCRRNCHDACVKWLKQERDKDGEK